MKAGKAKIGKDGVARVKIMFSAAERQRMFNRTGLEPSTSAWVPADKVAEYRRMAVFGRKNPTKAQKREKAKKASVQRRVAIALAKFLKQANPAMKTAGARIQKLKGGVLKITPIKANRARRKR